MPAPYQTGPAVLRIGNGPYLYSESGFKVALKTATGDITSDLHGNLGKHAISRMATITGKEVGRITAAILATLFPSVAVGASVMTPALVTFTGGGTTSTSTTITMTSTSGLVVGQPITGTNIPARSYVVSITNGTDAVISQAATGTTGSLTFTQGGDSGITIWTKAGQKIFWQRGGVTKFPELLMSASKQLQAGDFEVTALGAATISGSTSATSAAHWNAITTAAFTEATFDASLIKRYLYTAAYGSTPYDAITAQEGFKLQLALATETIADDNLGIGDIVAKGITAGVSFIPSNLTEAQIWTLLNLQDAAALLPGATINGDGATDLVITGADGTSGLSLTLNKPGFHDADIVYASGKLRAGEVQAVASRTFTAGAIDPLWTFVKT